MFVKLGEMIEISRVENTESCLPSVSPDILENFRKFATNLKKIAPKAEDFLYFSAIMMHAAEAAGLNDDGTPRLTIKGEPVQVGWNKAGGTWRWTTNDSSIKPYKNCFPAGTQILMEDGTSQNIEYLEPGDIVITHTGKAQKVLRKFITPHSGKLIELSVRNNRKILCTENHPFYKLNIAVESENQDISEQLLSIKSDNKEYQLIEASKLNKYDLLLSLGIDKTKDKFYDSYMTHSITNIDSVNYDGNVYNIEVENDHSYVANGIIVSNCNGDIFPEEELVKAYKKWIGKPLCVDHKSSSVDHVRGFIVDTYYDRNLKRVIALCALDKAGYPQLARQVSTGVSNCVSMGTAVGRAICSDCATVARTEQDFCDHMRRKSGYGEINIDLNPIELSIVVNGADPKANIKHIIAAANTLNSYVEKKEQELNKISEKRFSGTITVNDSNGNDSQNSQITINSGDLNKFKIDMEKAFEELQEINASANISDKDTNDLAFNQSSGSIAMEDTANPTVDSGLAPPHERYASANLQTETESLKELREVTKVIEQKLSQMKVSLDKLANSNPQEENMSGSEINKKGYFQGTEEPKPGQVQYPKDPMNEKVRESEDKHMLDHDTGPVDGMHPGTPSSGMSELERKKLLARAESEERAMRRQAIVNLAKEAIKNKEAYFQGGGGVNEPTPGKVKYPAEKTNDQLRDHEDKQMVGQKPFPGVGAVDGLHPSPDSADIADEKKRKELLQRASLRARFVKAANNDGTQNLGKSAWEVFLGDKLLLSASVNELSGQRSEMLYDSIATKEFGAKLIEKIKVQGADKVRSLVKSAQEVPAAAPPAEPTAPPAQDTGAEGDPKDNVIELSEKVRDLSSDLVEAVRALTGEQAEMGDLENGNVKAASDGANLNTIRKELNSGLTTAMKEVIAELDQHKEELDLITGLYDKDAVSASNQDLVTAVADDVINEAKVAVAEGFNLLSAFVKYARGTKAIVKRAEFEAELDALADGDSMNDEHDSHSSNDLMSLIQDTNSDLDAVKDMMEESDDDSASDSEVDDNDLDAKPEELKNLEVKPGTEVHVVASADFDSKEGRAVLRAKLASDALKFNPLLHDAHPKGGFTTQLDVKPQDDLAKVEDLEEVHDAMMDLANAPPKVRKEAEAIHKLVSEGKLEVADLDALVSEGLDKDAVSYYKKFYGQVDGGSEFASELVKEHAKAALEEKLNEFKIKMARAYELTYDMVSRGLCQSDMVSVSAQVEEIMNFNDHSFDSLKRVVAKHSPIGKVAGRMPQVGMIGSGDVNTTDTSGDDSLFSQLSSALSTSNKRNF